MSTLRVEDFAALRDRLAGRVVEPGHESWDEARTAWNLTADQHPAAVVVAASAEDIAETVRFAFDNGYGVTAQGTGHGAAALTSRLDGVILIKTHEMRGVEIDPETRTARAQAGALWMDVTAPAHEHGLAALAGSSPDVGVVGYTLGGGLSWLSRTYGVAANSVTAIEVVTADGQIIRTDADNDPALFWALRGGGGSFGIVTAIEFTLYPVPEVYAGVMFWPIERAAEVLHAWHDLVPSLPESMTTVGRLLMLPPIPEIPEPLRGRKFVVVEAIHLGDERGGCRAAGAAARARARDGHGRNHPDVGAVGAAHGSGAPGARCRRRHAAERARRRHDRRDRGAGHVGCARRPAVCRAAPAGRGDRAGPRRARARSATSTPRTRCSPSASRRCRRPSRRCWPRSAR